MELFLTILIVLASILVVLLVLVQNSKGGGLAAGFTSGNQVMGAPKTADFLEKATWTLMAIIFLMSIFAVGLHKQNARANDSESAISEQVQEAASEMQQQTATPAFDETEAEEE